MAKLTEEFLKAQDDRVLLGILCDKAYSLAEVSDLTGNASVCAEAAPETISEMSMAILEVERRIKRAGVQEVFHPIIGILGGISGNYLSPVWLCVAAVRVNENEKSIVQNPFSDWLDALERDEPQEP